MEADSLEENAITLLLISSASVSISSSSNARILRLILLSFVFKIFAFTFCPTFKTSAGFLIRFAEICEICANPLSPLPMLMNAP